MGLEGLGFVRKAGDAGVSGWLPGPWPIPNLGMQPDPRRRSRHSRAEKNFFGRRSRSKNGFEFIPPAAAGGSLRRCPPGRGALDGGVGGSPMGLALVGCSVGRGAAGRLRCVPSRASPWDGGVAGSPVGLALLGCSVGWGAAGRLRCVPSRASPWDGGVGEGPMGLARKGDSVGWSVAADCGVCPPGKHGGAAAAKAPAGGAIGWARNLPTDSVHWPPAPPAGRTDSPGG